MEYERSSDERVILNGFSQANQKEKDFVTWLAFKRYRR